MEGYRKLTALAQEYGLNLYFLETPKYERMYADEDYMELYELCLAEIGDIEENGEGKGSFTLICAEDLDFDSSDPGNFQDSDSSVGGWPDRIYAAALRGGEI